MLQCEQMNNEVKGKKCSFSYKERKKLVEAIRYVDMVIPGNSWEQKVDDVANGVWCCRR